MRFRIADAARTTTCRCSSRPGRTARIAAPEQVFCPFGQQESAHKTARAAIDPRASGWESRLGAADRRPSPRTGDAAQGPWFADPPSIAATDHAPVPSDEPATVPAHPKPAAAARTAAAGGFLCRLRPARPARPSSSWPRAFGWPWRATACCASTARPRCSPASRWESPRRDPGRSVLALAGAAPTDPGARGRRQRRLAALGHPPSGRRGVGRRRRTRARARPPCAGWAARHELAARRRARARRRRGGDRGRRAGRTPTGSTPVRRRARGLGDERAGRGRAVRRGEGSAGQRRGARGRTRGSPRDGGETPAGPGAERDAPSGGETPAGSGAGTDPPERGGAGARKRPADGAGTDAQGSAETPAGAVRRRARRTAPGTDAQGNAETPAQRARRRRRPPRGPTRTRPPTPTRRRRPPRGPTRTRPPAPTRRRRAVPAARSARAGGPTRLGAPPTQSLRPRLLPALDEQRFDDAWAELSPASRPGSAASLVEGRLRQDGLQCAEGPHGQPAGRRDNRAPAPRRPRTGLRRTSFSVTWTLERGSGEWSVVGSRNRAGRALPAHRRRFELARRWGVRNKSCLPGGDLLRTPPARRDPGMGPDRLTA